MRISTRALGLSSALLLAAGCGGPETTEADTLGAQTQGVTSGGSQNCNFTITAPQTNAPGQQPQWSVTVTRSASIMCPYPAASVVIGTTYDVPYISLATNDQGVAAAFAGRQSPSPRGNIQCSVNHVSTSGMNVVRNDMIVVMYGAGNVTSCNLSINNGTTLTAGGNKTGPLQGETGSGTHYVATYLNFFTSTTPPTYSAY